MLVSVDPMYASVCVTPILSFYKVLQKTAVHGFILLLLHMGIEHFQFLHHNCGMTSH
jgi:hypothetical protein